MKDDKMIHPSTVLVTGVAGFIGGCFARQFAKRFPHATIVGIDDLSAGRRDALDSSLVFYHGSILDEQLLDDIFSRHRPEYVFHFAALPRVSYSVAYPRQTSEVNIVGTVALLEVAKKYHAKRFVYSSSSSVYGGAKKVPTKETENPPDPKSPYAVQKHTGESFCKLFSELFGLETVCLRYFNVFGPGQYGDSPYSTVVCAWLEDLFFPKGDRAFIEGDGGQSRDFCYIDDVIEANILAMTSRRVFKGEPINIAQGDGTTINDVRRLITQHTGKKLDLVQRPARAGDVRHTRADISRAKRLLGYRPQVDFEEGLKRTIAWFVSREA